MTTYTINQISQINEASSPFAFAKKVTDEVISPLASAQFKDSEESIICVKAILFIDTKYQNAPNVLDVTTNTEEKTLNITFDYDYTEEIASEYNVWFIQMECSVDEGTVVETLVTKVKDLDPVTSRGTVTTVQPAE